jgi:hypothetical protein
MSLHLYQQCQRAQKPDAKSHPFLLGRSGAWFMVTSEATVSATAAVRGLYMGDFSTAQAQNAMKLLFPVIGRGFSASGAPALRV